MRVLLVARGYPSKEYPMNGIHEMLYAKTLHQAGIQVVLVALDMRSVFRKRKFWVEQTYQENIPIYTINIPVGAVDKRILGFFMCFGLTLLYRQIINRVGDFDIIHSHFTEVAYGTSLFNRTRHYPHVITEHSSLINREELPRDLKKIAAYAYSHCNRLMVGSPVMQKRIQRQFGIVAECIPILTNTDAFKPGLDKTESFCFVSTGNLKKAKGHRDVIYAFAKAFRGSDVKLRIYGQGEDKETLERIIVEKELSNQVFLKGQIDIQQIAKDYQKADCFILASHTETYGKAYVEALAAGLPIITTQNGGSEQFVNEKNGLIVPVGNVDEIAKAMKYIFQNREKYDKIKIARESLQLFGEDAVVKKLIDLYQEVIDEVNRWKDQGGKSERISVRK